MPPLPIISKPFGFFTCVNLSSVGWELFEPILEQPGVKSAAGPSEVQTEVVDVVDVDDDSSLSEGDSDDVHITGCEIMLAETRSGPVSDFSKPQPEPSPIFEERLDDFAEKVADIDVDLGEGPESPVENAQTRPVQTPQTGEGQKKKRIKVPARRTDLPLVRQFKGMQAKEAKQAKASSSPSQPRSGKPKPTPKSSRKSCRLASQSTSRPSKPAGSSKQEPPLVEEIVSLSESSPVRETRKAPAE